MRKLWRSLCRGQTSINAHHVETSIRPQSNQVASSERSRNAMGDNNVTRSDPPLSKDEIAGLFDVVEEYLGDTEYWELADDSTPDPTDAADSLHKLRATLRALAQENERLKDESEHWQFQYETAD